MTDGTYRVGHNVFETVMDKMQTVLQGPSSPCYQPWWVWDHSARSGAFPSAGMTARSFVVAGGPANGAGRLVRSYPAAQSPGIWCAMATRRETTGWVGTGETGRCNPRLDAGTPQTAPWGQFQPEVSGSRSDSPPHAPDPTNAAWASSDSDSTWAAHWGLLSTAARPGRQCPFRAGLFPATSSYIAASDTHPRHCGGSAAGSAMYLHCAL